MYIYIYFLNNIYIIFILFYKLGRFIYITPSPYLSGIVNNVMGTGMTGAQSTCVTRIFPEHYQLHALHPQAGVLVGVEGRGGLVNIK